MNKTSVKKTVAKFRVLGVVLTLATVPMLMGVAGCISSGSRYEQSTGERIDDRGASSNVKKSLAEDTQFKYPDVNVETFKGVVQLSGFVNTKDQKSRAGDLAKKTVGVTDVENNITVKE
jgi:hyperosmotically inducible protein